ncbi:MAG: AAA domain-containing protein [Desulfobaccales bacterium]
MVAEPVRDLGAKSLSLLDFLREAVRLGRPRQTEYRDDDRVLWFAELPQDCPEISSPALRPPGSEVEADYWLRVEKTPAPPRPALPEILKEWISEDALEKPGVEPVLPEEIRVTVKKEIPDPEAPPDHPRTLTIEEEKIRRVADHPEIEEAWLEYLMEKWEPWAQARGRWEEAAQVYGEVDFMRRRLEEAEERFELLLGVGLLQWRDSFGATIKRHLLLGPAEIEFDAARGRLTVVPAASFTSFRVALDMLEPQDQPSLRDTRVEDLLEDLEHQFWQPDQLGKILREITHRLRSDAVVEEAMAAAPRSTQVPLVRYAPALILRERRPTAYEEVISRLSEQAGPESDLPLPWRQFVAEGRLPQSDPATSESPPPLPVEDIFFPLAANAEQAQILERLNSSPVVVVKGPPGTGKSHTITNLICHLLARGEKILITAHTTKALNVLREMLPAGSDANLRDLCLLALGSSREDQQHLESGVRTIIERKNLWDQGQGEENARLIEQLSEERRQLRIIIAQVERDLRAFRERETHWHHLPGGYEGTAALIARRLEAEAAGFEWVPVPPHPLPDFPLTPPEVEVLAEVHGRLTPAEEEELRRETGDFALPSPEEFQELVEKLQATAAQAASLEHGADAGLQALLAPLSREALETGLTEVSHLHDLAFLAARSLGSLAQKILEDSLAGEVARWQDLSDQVGAIATEMGQLMAQVQEWHVELTPERDPLALRADAHRRLTHLQAGGRRGFWLFRPRVIRETQYLLQACRVAGRPPDDVETLKDLLAQLDLKLAVQKFFSLWPGSDLPSANLAHRARQAREQAAALRDYLHGLQSLGNEFFSSLPPEQRVHLAQPEARERWRLTLQAEVARRELQEQQHIFTGLARQLRVPGERAPHPCLTELAGAVERLDPAAWDKAWHRREEVRRRQERLTQYQRLITRIQETWPEMAARLRAHQGDPAWQSCLLALEQAWHWASARGWLEQFTDPSRWEEKEKEHHRLQHRLQEVTARLAAAKAWAAFFGRLDDFTRQNLQAWSDAMRRIGRGTGRYVLRRRREARRYLQACLPAIPAWIMPLHKLWETVDPSPGMFDTVIIDEASQAEITSLILFLLARRVIVVGDKMQNSPEAVGIREDAIERLGQEHLRDFHFRAEFRPDTSLFDHAERAFSNLISLREHFRCVPEIIRFSNDLCYREAPLIPLRQPPPERLPPLKKTLVPGGYCEGEGQRLRNDPEAEALVAQVCRCLEDPAYEGKTFGVIVLQGRAQAELIERKLMDRVDPRTLRERRFRCGIPPTFQGDQREVIFLSLVVSPDYKFRALTEMDFVRRFNVAMSRARDQVWLFHSVQLSDLHSECLRARLLRFFDSPWIVSPEAEELERLERASNEIPRSPGSQPPPYESWFEVDVAMELLRRRYRVLPQYEAAGYRIDLVVEGGDRRLAVECDGEAWHGPDRYEADLARQRQLERVGWQFVRLRESEFYADRSRAVARIVQACDDMGIYPVGESPEPEESGTEEPEPPAAEAAVIASEGETPEKEEAPGVAPLAVYPDPREASLPQLAAVLKKIIEVHGPLTLPLLYRLYLAGCPDLGRLGQALKGRLDEALGSLVRAGEIVLEDELGQRKPEGKVARLAGSPPVVERPAGLRKLEEIPPREIFLLMDRWKLPASLDDREIEEYFFRKIIEHFGYQKLTANRRQHLRRLYQVWRRRQRQLWLVK